MDRGPEDLAVLHTAFIIEVQLQAACINALKLHRVPIVIHNYLLVSFVLIFTLQNPRIVLHARLLA